MFTTETYGPLGRDICVLLVLCNTGNGRIACLGQ